MQPRDSPLVIAGEKIRAPEDPMENPDRGIVRVEAQCMLDQRERFRRAADKGQRIAFMRVSQGEILIELDRPVESLQR